MLIFAMSALRLVPSHSQKVLASDASDTPGFRHLLPNALSQETSPTGSTAFVGRTFTLNANYLDHAFHATPADGKKQHTAGAAQSASRNKEIQAFRDTPSAAVCGAGRHGSSRSG